MKHENLAASVLPESTPAELLRMARQYGAAACELRPSGSKIGWAPYRFCLLHATELCMSALLLHYGHDWRELRRMHHDLSRRAALCAAHGLKLKKRSQELILHLSNESAYRNTRYEFATARDGLHPSQLLALFVDVADKTCGSIRRSIV